jgi:hypothetical protein
LVTDLVTKKADLGGSNTPTTMQILQLAGWNSLRISENPDERKTGGEGGINIHRLNIANNTGKFLL